MTDLGRKRIDVSGDTHALLDAESKRRGVPVRDLLDQAVKEMLDRSARTALAVRQQRETRHADRVEEQTAQLADLGRRFTALLNQQAKDLPAALTAGFDAIKDTIRNTGGTGHLRQMIEDFQEAFFAKFDETATSIKTSIAPILEVVNERADKLDERFTQLEEKQINAKRAFGRGTLSGLVLLFLIGFVLPDTPPTRWLSARFVGASSAEEAAWILAGDGRVRGELMAETKGLLHNSAFRTRYAACAEQAKRTKTAFTCRLRFPALNDITQ